MHSVDLNTGWFRPFSLGGNSGETIPTDLHHGSSWPNDFRLS